MIRSQHQGRTVALSLFSVTVDCIGYLAALVQPLRVTAKEIIKTGRVTASRFNRRNTFATPGKIKAFGPFSLDLNVTPDAAIRLPLSPSLLVCHDLASGR